MRREVFKLIRLMEEVGDGISDYVSFDVLILMRVTMLLRFPW